MRPVLSGPHPRKGLRASTGLVLALAAVLASGAAACLATAPEQAGMWGSGQANLTIVDTSATLHILASGGCYGSYGEFDHLPPSGAFSIPGTYTQLIGAYPGKVQYAAEFSGTVGANQLSVTVTVPPLQEVLGPFTLARGASTMWPACLYP
jgi:hypothetical protein